VDDKQFHLEIFAIRLSAVRAMFSSRHFSTCPITDAAETVNISARKHPEWDKLIKAHCINFYDMSPELKRELVRMAANILRVSEEMVCPTAFKVGSGSGKFMGSVHEVRPEKEFVPAKRSLLPWR
jgi:hypothetical protein